MDWSKHNDEVKKVWDAYRKGKPLRVPVIFAVNPRVVVLNLMLNPKGYSFGDYINNPDVMIEMQLEFQKWRRLNCVADWEMGLPEAWDPIYVDLQNVGEAAWFGCDIVCYEDSMPRFLPMFHNNKESLYDWGVDDYLKGHYPQAYDFFEYFRERSHNLVFEDRPVNCTTNPGFLGTDGPFTVACNLRGATEVCLDIYEDPDYFHDLMKLITDTTIRRMKTWMDYLDISYPFPQWGFADDSIELLSPSQYREHVLPYHRKLINEFSEGGPNSIHLCGKAYHQFKTLKEELNIMIFNTGYPTDLALARRELGAEVELQGNIHPELLRSGTQKQVTEVVRTLLQSGVMDGGKFILMDGHNIAPGTPVENLSAMYEAGKEYGRY